MSLIAFGCHGGDSSAVLQTVWAEGLAVGGWESWVAMGCHGLPWLDVLRSGTC